MSTKNSPVKRRREQSERAAELHEVALAAIASYKKQKEVNDFINYLLESLEGNSSWLNTVMGKQTNFKFVLMAGAGPNRFQIREIIYPAGDDDITLEVEFQDSDDYDKIAVAAIIKLCSSDIDRLMKYIKTHLFDNSTLKEDLLKGKALGISFAILRPFAEKQYRVMERIVIGSSMKNMIPAKKIKDDRLYNEPPVKKAKKIFA